MRSVNSPGLPYRGTANPRTANPRTAIRTPIEMWHPLRVAHPGHVSRKRQVVVPLPLSRIHVLNTLPVKNDGRFVLYWMVTARRLRFNFALQHAVECANTLRLPLVIFEALRCDYPWANDRLHAFALEGMAANARGIGDSSVVYYPYVEPGRHHARGLLRSLSAHAAVIVTDFHPGFFIPRMLRERRSTGEMPIEAVDSNGLIPLADHGRAFPTARGIPRLRSAIAADASAGFS